MASSLLVIVEFGAQKQRISLNPNSSYRDICDQIYSLFKVDASKSTYLLQRQDSLKLGSFVNVDEHSFLNDLKHHTTNRLNQAVMRLRLVPVGAKSSSKPTNGVTNGEKTWSTSSQYQQDESDRASTTSTAAVDVKQLIKKCLSNLKETTDSIQLLDRYLHPEDYPEDEHQSTNKPSIHIQPPTTVSTNDIHSQILQTSSVSNSRLPSFNDIDELVPALSHLMNVPQPLPPPPPPSSSNLPKSQTAESPSVLCPTVVKAHIQPVVSTTNVPSRPPTKSFSNRLGVITPASQTSASIAREPKSISTAQNFKSPVLFEPSNGSLHHQSQPESQAKEIPLTLKPKSLIELKQFPAGATIEGIVSVASNASYFFLQVIDQSKDEFDRLSKSLHEYYSNLDKNLHFRPSPGDYCVAMYTEDARWYRARIIRYLSDQTCEVFYVDYGNMEELPIELLHEMLPGFTGIPARAIACTIAEILPPVGQEGWTKRATFAFASRCNNERVQATVVASTKIKWPMHIVQLRVSKTQEDIGASLEACKVARRVSNDEICEFWSNKIRVEQYILYNMPDPDRNRFPAIEQGPSKSDHEESTNAFLSSSLQQASSTTDDSTGENTLAVEETSLSKEDSKQTMSTIVVDDQVTEPEQNHGAVTDLVEEKVIERKVTTPATPSSSLNPEATPFSLLSTEKVENTHSISTGDESDDENDPKDTPISSDSSKRPRMPIKDDVIVDTSLMPSTPLAKSWLPIEISHIETPTRFYIRYIYGPGWNLGNGPTPELIDTKERPEKNVVLKELTQEMTQCYNKHKRVCPGDNYDEGELVAVKSRLQWHRGRFIQYKPNIDFAHVFFADHGFTRSLPIQMIRPINNRFVLHAEQAHLVHLHQPGQRRGRIEWNTNTIDEFRELTKDGTSLYARIVNESNTVDLMSYDPLTKKWFSFYEHFVKHLHDHDRAEEKTE